MEAPRQRSLSTPRRTFSLPARPRKSTLAASFETSRASKSAPISGENIEVLFAHGASRIVNFTVNTLALKSAPLPWRSPEERTIASGPLRIYKTIPHNIAFLQSGSALKPLLSKTQCWDVDGKRVFCLQLRPGSYWRIEILGLEDEQALRAAEFRNVLVKTVAYEMTACPFIRAEDCAPLIEAPGAMLPVRVWRRPSLKEIPTSGLLQIEKPEDSQQIERSKGPRRKLFHEWSRSSQLEEQTASQQNSQLGLVIDKHGGVKERCRLFEKNILADYGLESSYNGNNNEGSPTGTPNTCQDEDSFSSASTCVSKSEANLGDWLDFTPPITPSSPHRPSALKKSNLSPFKPTTVVAPPVIDDAKALGVSSRHPSPPSTPPRRVVSTPAPPGAWYTPGQSPGEYSLRMRRKIKAPVLVDVEVSSSALAEAAQVSPALSTPNLTSGSDSEDDVAEIQTPPRPAASSTWDSKIPNQRLRKTASSLILSRTTSLATATATYVVIKPSAYLMAAMFSIASRIAARAVTGAAYQLHESRSWGESWSDDELDGLDDFGTCHPGEAWERERERRAWGLED
ncbi:inheritance of peroxisomes protein 1-domain-containing protein [Geopyxis carbonaria]|nr:inheritance of peroxisomes protein 1-domain-containing protein [Geopyxis carbonaria]